MGSGLKVSKQLIWGEEYRNVTATGSPIDRSETQVVHVRYWASARAAAGTDAEELVVEGPTTLADVVRRLVASHADAHFTKVVGVCSILVGDRPVKALDPETVEVRPGERVELLPPFAGG